LTRTSAGNNPDAETLSELYMFFSLLMRYPEADFLTDDFLEAYENLLSGLELKDELDELKKCRSNDNNLLQTLRIEYTRLFINAVPHMIAPPFASVYMDGDHDLQGKTTEKTRDFYRAHGYDVPNVTEPADHIAYELEFLAALARDSNLDAEQEFIRTLFRPWFTQFHDRLRRETIHPYFRIGLELIDSFTDKDA
jgi:TorA maturation chaperone TorD